MKRYEKISLPGCPDNSKSAIRAQIWTFEIRSALAQYNRRFFPYRQTH
jgi:hypothetical protein